MPPHRIPLARRLVEAVAWCEKHARVEDPAGSLRTIRPFPADSGQNRAVMTQPPAGTYDNARHAEGTPLVAVRLPSIATFVARALA